MRQNFVTVSFLVFYFFSRVALADPNWPLQLRPAIPAELTAGNAASFTLSGYCAAGQGDVNIQLGTLNFTTPCMRVLGIYFTRVDASSETSTNPLLQCATQGASPVMCSGFTDNHLAPPSLILQNDPLLTINGNNENAYQVVGECSPRGASITVDIGAQLGILSGLCTNSFNFVLTGDVSAVATGTSIPVVATIDDTVQTTVVNSTVDKLTGVFVTIETAVDIDRVNVSSYGLSGLCSDDGEEVTIDVGGVVPLSQPTCSGGAWSVTGLNVSSLIDGAVTITADHMDGLGMSAPQASVSVTKDTAPLIFSGSSNQTPLGTNLNGGASNLLWSTTTVNPSYFELDAGDNSIIRVLQPGDYRVSLALPLNGAILRGNILAQVLVNGLVVPGAASASSYIRNGNGQQESSDHIDIVLNALSIGDEVQIQIEQVANGGTINSNPNALILLEALEIDTTFVATGTAVVGGANYNNTGPDQIVWLQSQVSSPFIHSDSTNPHQITLNQSGNYFVSLNIPYQATSNRVSVVSNLVLGTVPVVGTSARQGYIRNASGHNEASIHWSGFLNGVTAGQTLEIDVARDGAGGTVTNLSGQEAGISIELVSSVDIISLRGVDVVAGTNWNQTSEVDWVTSEVINSSIFSHNPLSNGHQITVLSPGDYFVAYSDSLNSTTARNNVRIEVLVNGFATGLRCVSHYIRSASGHNDSSCSLTGLLDGLSVGDIITVQTSQEGNGGTATSSDEARLFIQRK